MLMLHTYFNTISFDTLHLRHLPYVAHEYHLRKVVLW